MVPYGFLSGVTATANCMINSSYAIGSIYINRHSLVLIVDVAIPVMSIVGLEMSVL